MKRKILLSLASIILIATNATAQAIGSWKAHMAYSDVTWIEPAAHKLYVLASGNLYAYNRNDQSIETFDKTNVLNDCGIHMIAWNSSVRKLVIVYDNYNIDLLDDRGEVVNISDYQNKSMPEDKTVNHLYMSGPYCYISTGFGIIKLNIAQAEISDTYKLGFKVDYCYTDRDAVYAACRTKGLFRGWNTSNLLDKSNWQFIDNYKAQPRTIPAELLDIVKTLQPGGPKYNHFAFMLFASGALYTVGGLYQSGKSQLNLPGIVQVLRNGEWNIFQENVSSTTGYAYEDNNTIAVDPRNPNRVFVGGRTGLYEFNNGQLAKFYNRDNSLLGGAIDNKNKELGNDYVLINGLTFAPNGTLWILNSQARNQNILSIPFGGEMTSHSQRTIIEDGRSLTVLSSPLVDSRGLLWFCNDYYDDKGLFCYNIARDTLFSVRRFYNQDSREVQASISHCVAEDPQGNIWLGTNVGPIVLETSQFSNLDNPIFTQVKIPRNDGTNLADYLLSGVDITCIAIDAGGRKWFGTNDNGVYLISSDNMTQLQHFLSTNSPLLSNNIQSIAINHATGEVFFGTDKGLCSYASDATESPDNPGSATAYAYPNPVKPGYKGLITVGGLVHNATVKIVTSTGVLVAEGMANGGTFTWNGNDRHGKRVSSGVYMVLSADQNGKQGAVCKIAVVN